MAGPFTLPRPADGIKATRVAGKKLSTASAEARKPASVASQMWKEGYYDYEPGGKPASDHADYMRGWKEAASE